MQATPYLFFEGHCEEAMAFYGSALGAETRAVMRYRESPTPAQVPPGNTDRRSAPRPGR